MAPESSREDAAPLRFPEIVTFPTELDVSNSELFEAELLAAFRPGVAVVIADMSRTESCYCTGARCLLAAHKLAAGTGAQLRVVAGSALATRVFQLIGSELLIFPEMTAALTGAPRVTQPHSAAQVVAAGMQERCETALAWSHELADRVARTHFMVRERRAATGVELLQHSEFARLYKRAGSMPAIEQAKGILMYYEHCTDDEAFDLLRRASQRSNVPLREIAAALVDRTSRARGGRSIPAMPGVTLRDR